MDSDLNNPFSFGQTVAGEQFTDRAKERAELRQEFLSGQNVILTSPRRYGKTSLVREVLKQLPAKTHVSLVVDLFRESSKKRLLEIYAHALSQSVSNKMQDIPVGIWRWLRC